jgi:hypothetical protein
MDVAAAAIPDRRTPAAARYSIDIGSAAFARSGMQGMAGSRPVRASPWGRDGMPVAAPMAAHTMHAAAAAMQGRAGSSPHAAQQHQQHQAELRQRAAVSARSQQQSWTNYAAVSCFAAEACEPPIVRTNSGGSSGSGSSSCSTYAASRQQQQMMQVAMQSEMFAGRDSHARPAAAAVDAVQQHKQHMAALQVIEDEITYLVRLLGCWGIFCSMLRHLACCKISAAVQFGASTLSQLPSA